MNDPSHDTRDRTKAMLRSDVAEIDDGKRHGMLILIAHPEDVGLGSRTRIFAGSALTVGRGHHCELAFPEVPSLSRRHAEIRFETSAVVVEDCESTNGTFINDRRVIGTADLANGDRLQMGSLHFKFLLDEDVEAAYHEAIHQLVMQDGLTEISNRRRFTEELSREFARARRHDRPLALVVFDIDRFKLVNDTYGHLCGDVVLKSLARLCSDRLRSEQVFARLGGDEFVILCPETAIDGAELLAERLRSSVEQHRWGFDVLADELRVTCSFGCAELADHMERYSELLDAADRALYDAKNDGRNRVVGAAAEPR